MHRCDQATRMEKLIATINLTLRGRRQNNDRRQGRLLEAVPRRLQEKFGRLDGRLNEARTAPKPRERDRRT